MTDRELLFEHCMQADLVDSSAVLKVLTSQKTITSLVKEAHKTAEEHGWWESGTRPFLELICLMHCELSEAAEAYRNKEGDDRIVEELADVVIRIFDLCGSRGWNLEKSVLSKMAFNKTRPYRHGGKLA